MEHVTGGKSQVCTSENISYPSATEGGIELSKCPTPPTTHSQGTAVGRCGGNRERLREFCFAIVDFACQEFSAPAQAPGEKEAVRKSSQIFLTGTTQSKPHVLVILKMF